MITGANALGQATEDVARTVELLRNAVSLFETAYNAGFNCGATGPTETNSHPCWLSTQTLMSEWERGKRAGENWLIRNMASTLRRCPNG